MLGTTWRFSYKTSEMVSLTEMILRSFFTFLFIILISIDSLDSHVFYRAMHICTAFVSDPIALLYIGLY